MKKLFKYTILICCLLLSLALYGRGSLVGGTVFLIAGALFEALFWIGLFSNSKKKAS